MPPCKIDQPEEDTTVRQVRDEAEHAAAERQQRRHRDYSMNEPGLDRPQPACLTLSQRASSTTTPATAMISPL